MKRTLPLLSLLALSLGPLAFAGGKAPAKAPQRVEISVTPDGFTVANPHALKAGEKVTLVVTRTTDKTCATDIVIKDFGINQPLPLNKAVEVSFVPRKAGAVHFACAMDMVTGELKVE